MDKHDAKLMNGSHDGLSLTSRQLLLIRSHPDDASATAVRVIRLVSSDTSLRRTDNMRVHSVTYVHTLEATTSRQELLGTSGCWEFCQEAPEWRANEPVHRLSSTTLEGHACHATRTQRCPAQTAAGWRYGGKEGTAGRDGFLNNVEPEFCSPAAAGAVCFAPLLHLWPDSSSVTAGVCACCGCLRAEQR